MPIGIYGTLPHILTNKKIENKKGAVKDYFKESSKGVRNICIAQLGIFGAGAGATVAVNKFMPKFANTIKERLGNISKIIADQYSKIPVEIDKEVKTNLKDFLKESGFVNAVRAIPAPIKGGFAALAALLPVVALAIIAKARGNMAAKEAKYEVK